MSCWSESILGPQPRVLAALGFWALITDSMASLPAGGRPGLNLGRARLVGVGGGGS